MATTLSRRATRLQELANPLPGSVPGENRRPIRIPQSFDGHKLIEFLVTAFPHHLEKTWRELCIDGRLRDAHDAAVASDQIIHAGERYYHVTPSEIEPDIHAGISFIYEDDSIVVIEKPAPLPVHPSGRFNRNTLQYFLNAIYAPERPRPAHRLDANTTGIMVCARTKHIARLLQPQFEDGTVEKTYLARVHHHPPTDAFSCDVPISASAGTIGSRVPDHTPNGLAARTHFRVKERFDDGTALLEAIPVTGRTNQIRVHLWSMGLPIVGDTGYLPEGEIGTLMTRHPTDPPMCLHAAEIRFRHPIRNEQVVFEASVPAWAKSKI